MPARTLGFGWGFVAVPVPSRPLTRPSDPHNVWNHYRGLTSGAPEPTLPGLCDGWGTGCRVDEQELPQDLIGLIAAVVTAEMPSMAALKVTGFAVDFLVSSVVASRLYQIWAAPQDRI